MCTPCVSTMVALGRRITSPFSRSRGRFVQPVLIFYAALAGFADTAEATTFHMPYGSSSKNEAALSGSSSFEVDGVPQYSETKWYFNGAYQETDNSGFLALDPQFTRTFANGVYRIRAVVSYNSKTTISKTHTWEFRVGKPDLVIDYVVLEPRVPLAGTSFQVTTYIRNAGGITASAGPLRDQEVFFYFNNGFVGEANHDDLSSFSAGLALYSPAMTAPAAGNYTVNARVDANDEIDESNENNNLFGVVLTIRGSDWVLVPDVTGMQQEAAENMMANAGVTNLDVQTAYHASVPAGVVISQLPAGPNMWIPPSETVTLLVSLGPPCAITVKRPGSGAAWKLGSKPKIKWNAVGTCCAEVRIELWQSGQKVRNIKKSTPNDGRVRWKIKQSRFAVGLDYEIKIVCDETRYGDSAPFSLVDP